MPDKSSRYYWDSCVFLNLVSPDPNHPEHFEAVKHWLTEAQEGRIRIFTSAISITEVAFGTEEQIGRRLSEETEAQINELWHPTSPVTLVEYSRSIAYRARELIRAGLPGQHALKPYDAIHLASAEYAEVEALHSYNGPLKRYTRSVVAPPFEVSNPPESYEPPLFTNGGEDAEHLGEPPLP